MHEFFNRVEVRDIAGETTSVLFGNEAGSLDFRELRVGSTLYVRYAAKCFFSDLSTQVSAARGGRGTQSGAPRPQPLCLRTCFQALAAQQPSVCV